MWFESGPEVFVCLYQNFVLTLKIAQGRKFDGRRTFAAESSSSGHGGRVIQTCYSLRQVVPVLFCVLPANEKVIAWCD